MELNDFKIVPLDESHIPDAIKLLDRYLGDGIYSREELEEIAGKPHKHFDLFYKDGDLKALFYCQANVKKYFEETYWNVKEIQDLIKGPEDRVFGYLHSIVLKEELRGCGLAAKIQNHYTDILFNEDHAEFVFTLGWVKKDGIPSQNVLEHYGYKLYGVVKSPWYYEENLNCQECGQEHCICDGALYIQYKGDYKNEKK